MRDRRAEDIDDAFVPRQAASAYTVEIDGDAVVLDEELNRLHLLNTSAALVWTCFDGTGTLGEIAHDLADVAGLPAADLLADLLALARTLGAEGLLDGVAPGPDASGFAVGNVEVSGLPSG